MAAAEAIGVSRLQAEFSAENYVYEEQLDWAKVRKLAGTRSNVYVILQVQPPIVGVQGSNIHRICAIGFIPSSTEKLSAG